MLCDSNQDVDKEKQYIRLLENRWVEGIILDSSADAREHGAYINYLMQRVIKDKGIPIVSLERGLKDTEFSAVVVDNEQAGYEATKHLIGLGHKHIAHIAGHYKFPMSRDWRRGYKRALEENGIIFDDGLVRQGDFSPLSGYNAMKELLMEGRDFTALFAGNDQMAIGAMKAIKETGLRIPEDVAVVGFDNIPAASLVDPPLSIINVPKYRMGALAMEMLDEYIKNPNTSSRIEILPSNLIIRSSSDPHANGSWDLFGW
jgi:DNA-binding LacI/PurR family transcriptional regulator